MTDQVGKKWYSEREVEELLQKKQDETQEQLDEHCR